MTMSTMMTTKKAASIPAVALTGTPGEASATPVHCDTESSIAAAAVAAVTATEVGSKISKNELAFVKEWSASDVWGLEDLIHDDIFLRERSIAIQSVLAYQEYYKTQQANCTNGTEMILEDLDRDNNNNNNSSAITTTTPTGLNRNDSVLNDRYEEDDIHIATDSTNISTSSSLFHREWDKASSFIGKDPFSHPFFGRRPTMRAAIFITPRRHAARTPAALNPRITALTMNEQR
jgi:hypothetical protein